MSSLIFLHYIFEQYGTTRRVILRQGNENKAGTKHVLFRHYDIQSSPIEADDILLIPNIIANGARKKKKDGGKIKFEYTFGNYDNVIYVVVTELNNRNEEVFCNFYSKNKAKQTTRRTHTEVAQDMSDSLNGNKNNTNDSNTQVFRSADGTIYAWVDRDIKIGNIAQKNQHLKPRPLLPGEHINQLSFQVLIGLTQNPSCIPVAAVFISQPSSQHSCNSFSKIFSALSFVVSE